MNISGPLRWKDISLPDTGNNPRFTKPTCDFDFRLEINQNRAYLPNNPALCYGIRSKPLDHHDEPRSDFKTVASSSDSPNGPLKTKATSDGSLQNLVVFGSIYFQAKFPRYGYWYSVEFN